MVNWIIDNTTFHTSAAEHSLQYNRILDTLLSFPLPIRRKTMLGIEILKCFKFNSVYHSSNIIRSSESLHNLRCWLDSRNFRLEDDGSCLNFENRGTEPMAGLHFIVAAAGIRTDVYKWRTSKWKWTKSSVTKWKRGSDIKLERRCIGIYTD